MVEVFSGTSSCEENKRCIAIYYLRPSVTGFYAMDGGLEIQFFMEPCNFGGQIFSSLGLTASAQLGGILMSFSLHILHYVLFS